MRSSPVVTDRVVLATALLALGGIGCSSSDSDPNQDQQVETEGEFLSSKQQRMLTPDATDAEIEQLAQGNTQFAFDLYDVLQDGQTNLFFSPFSISVALAMTYAGAEGNTETQMKNAMHFTLAEDRLHNAFNAVDLALASRGEGAQGQDDKGFRLNVVNATWGQRDYPFQDDYLDVLAINYGAGVRLADFVARPEDSRTTINAWVEEQTEDRIKDLLPQGTITSDTRLVLTNAIYFNAAWASPFEASSSSDRSFTRLDGNSISVPMMTQISSYGYVDGGTYQAVELPYDGGELSMVLIVPADVGIHQNVEAGLDAEFISTVVTSLTPKTVNLTVPKFEFESTLDVGTTLVAMGMSDAFDAGSADFSGIDDGYRKDLHISDVLHKAFVAVNEKGTEAAAATAVVVGIESMPSFDVQLTVDRPFFFLIRDIKTNAVLFVGRVVDPTA